MKLQKLRRSVAEHNDGLTLSGLSSESIEQIKKSLTFDNPAYATVQRYSRYAYTNVPPFLTYYEQKGGVIKVPRGYDISGLECDELDYTVAPKVDHAPFVLTLRDSQKEAAEAYISSNKTLTLQGCIQMPTGKGKSILGLFLAAYYSVKTLIVVHKDDLVKGWQEDIALAFDKKVNAGLIKAKNRRVGHFLTIATVQTLNRLPAEELEALYNQFGLVIQDEMHHCPATSFEVVSKFKSRYKLGLTATPERTDGLAHVMNLYYGAFCYRYKSLADDEDILPVHVVIRKNPFYFNPLCEKIVIKGREQYRIVDLLYPDRKDLTESQKRLSDVPYSIRPKVSFQTIDDIVVREIKEFVCADILREYDKGRSCVVFFTQKEHCRLYYDCLAESISEEHLGLYYGDSTNNDEVKEKAERTRKFVTLTTYAKATEGTNVKQWEVEFLVSSINNEKNVEQAAGRVRRTKEGNKITPALLYDYRTPYVYSLASHGNTRDRRYKALHFTFEGQKPRQGLFTRGYK